MVEEQPIKGGNRSDGMRPDDLEPDEARIGRRESEPHSEEVTYLFDVLRSNFPQSRPTWDLHHYFKVGHAEFDIRLDVSFFKDWAGPRKLSSYNASTYGGRVPNLGINVLSKSTWKDDVGENADICRMVGIPVYVIFSPYHVASNIYKPPFLRVYMLGKDGNHSILERHEITLKEGGEMNWKAVIDCEDRLPFAFGLMELADKHEEGWPLFRLILIDRESKEILLTRAEQEKARAEREKARAEREKARAEQEKARAEREKARAEQEKARAEREKARADKAIEELDRLRDTAKRDG
jgi:Uma2 family endonuclease